MKLILLTLLALSSGCGRAHGEYEGFEAYVTTFAEEAEARGVKIDTREITIRMVNEFSDNDLNDSSTVGACYYGGVERKEHYANYIEVLASYWHDEASSEERENLIFHELGHCILDLDHAPCSNVMCEYILSPIDWSTNRTQYIDFLFKK